MASSLVDALGSETGGLTMLKLLADNSFDSILVTDASARGRIIYANKAFKKLTGHDPAEVIGKDPRMLQGPGTDRKVIEKISATLKAGESLTYSLTEGRRAYLVPAVGAIEVNGVPLNARDGAAIRDEAEITITAKDDAELVMVDSL